MEAGWLAGCTIAHRENRCTDTFMSPQRREIPKWTIKVLFLSEGFSHLNLSKMFELGYKFVLFSKNWNILSFFSFLSHWNREITKSICKSTHKLTPRSLALTQVYKHRERLIAKTWILAKRFLMTWISSVHLNIFFFALNHCFLVLKLGIRG